MNNQFYYSKKKSASCSAYRFFRQPPFRVRIPGSIFRTKKKIRKPFSLRIFLAEREGFGNLCCAKLPALGDTAPARRLPKNLPPAGFLHGNHPFGCESHLLLQKERTERANARSVLFFGGKRGIRTLGGFMAHTRFPVVRLRPAQPSFHVEVLTRFELVNEGFADLCLTTWPQHQKNGAAYEARTRYLHLGKVALYQMS